MNKHTLIGFAVGLLFANAAISAVFFISVTVFDNPHHLIFGCMFLFKTVFIGIMIKIIEK